MLDLADQPDDYMWIEVPVEGMCCMCLTCIPCRFSGMQECCLNCVWKYMQLVLLMQHQLEPGALIRERC